MRWTAHLVYIGEMKIAYKISVVKIDWKTPTGKLRNKLADNIKVHLQEI
jgi:hypothetical protein